MKHYINNQRKRYGFFRLALITGVVLGISGWILVTQRLGADHNNTKSQDAIVGSDPVFGLDEIQPVAFVEMTIPYLRSRSYASAIGTRELVSSQTSYTSYLTSYDSDGLRINALLTVPTGTPPDAGWPAIVFVHGYIPPQNYKTQSNYASYVDYLARQGFVIFKIDLRGHADSEGDPGGAYYSSDYVIDTLNAYRALQGAGDVDAHRIGLWGHSMAGNVVSRAMASMPTIPAVAIWAGAVYTYTDFAKYRIADTSYQPRPSGSPANNRRNELFMTHGQFDPDSLFWKQVPMTNYLDGISGAIGLFHAIDDSVVDIGYSRDVVKLLEAASVKHEFHEYQTGGHNFTGATFSKAMDDTISFFRKYMD